jgi:hypothetical protein
MLSKAWAFGRALAGIVGSKPTGGMDVRLLWVFLCCHVEVSATDWSLVQRNPTKCGVSKCDLETSKRRRRRPNLGCCATGKEMCIIEKASVIKPRNKTNEISKWQDLEGTSQVGILVYRQFWVQSSVLRPTDGRILYTFAMPTAKLRDIT